MSKEAKWSDTPDSIEVIERLFRRKPLLVEAEQVHSREEVDLYGQTVILEPGDWVIKEGGRRIIAREAEFNGLYELAEIEGDESLESGLPDMELGTSIEKAGKRMVRVEVRTGRGAVAYWHNNKNNGADASFIVIADNVDNIHAAHRVGKFIEPFEGKPNTRTWVII